MSPEHRTLLARIGAAADAVRRAVEGVPAGRDGHSPRDGEWSVRETLVHLRNTAVLVHGLRIRRLLYETAPVFADYDEPAHRREALAAGEPTGELVETIVAEHAQIVRLLRALPADRWPRQGRHPELGVMSIEFLARRLAEHAEEHAGQIAATVTALRAGR
jgi:DinB family protein